MSSPTTYRLSGIALLFGSILSIVYYFLQSFGNDGDLKTLTSPLFMISSVIGFIGALLVLLGLPGMFIRQARQAGILTLIGFLSVAYITLFSGVLIPFTSITVIPVLAAKPATQALATTPPPLFDLFFFISLPAQLLGTIALAIATLRARIFPRWSAWLLIAVPVLGLASFLPFYPPMLNNLGPMLAYLALAGFGYALITLRQSETAPALSTTTVGAPSHA